MTKVRCRAGANPLPRTRSQGQLRLSRSCPCPGSSGEGGQCSAVCGSARGGPPGSPARRARGRERSENPELIYCHGTWLPRSVLVFARSFLERLGGATGQPWCSKWTGPFLDNIAWVGLGRSKWRGTPSPPIPLPTSGVPAPILR